MPFAEPSFENPYAALAQRAPRLAGLQVEVPMADVDELGSGFVIAVR
jgi:hypothetical protein